MRRKIIFIGVISFVFLSSFIAIIIILLPSFRQSKMPGLLNLSQAPLQPATRFHYSSVAPHGHRVSKRDTYPTLSSRRTTRQSPRANTYQSQYMGYYIPAVRNNLSYRPPPRGKAFEFFGVQDVREFEQDIAHKNRSAFPFQRRAAKPKQPIRPYPSMTAHGPPPSRFSWDGDEDERPKKRKKRSMICTIL
jgi:hypothetical protein